MARIIEDSKKKMRQQSEFKSVNTMRLSLGMPILEKGWMVCISDCGDEFYSFDKKGNRMCDTCRSKPRIKAFQDFNDAHLIGV